MAYIILSGRRTRQPQWAARVRPYWLERGLTFLLNGATFTDLVGSIQATKIGTIGKRGNAGRYGGYLGPDFDGSNSLEFADSPANRITGPLTWIWRGTFDNFSTYRHLLSHHAGGGGTNAPYSAYVDPGNFKVNALRSNASGFRGAILDTTAITANQQTTIGMMYSSGLIETLPVAFVNSTLQSISQTYIGSGQCTGDAYPLRIGIRDDSVVLHDGSVELVALFSSALAEAEYLAIEAAPWGELTLSDPRSLYFGAGATGVTNYELDAQPATFAVTGTAATLARSWLFDAQPATFQVTGAAATLARGLVVNAGPGSFAVTGVDAGLEKATPGVYTIDAQPGTFAVTGTAATLTYTPVNVYTLDAQPGSFAVTGVAATLTYTPLNVYTLDAQPATFTITGANAQLVYTGASIWTDIAVNTTTWTDLQ